MGNELNTYCKRKSHIKTKLNKKGLIFYYTKPNIQQARLQYKEKYEKEWER